MKISTFIATGAGVGYMPFASGTFGTLLAVPLYWLLMTGLNMLAGDSLLVRVIYLTVVAGVFLAGCQTAGVAETYFASKDPGQVVIDEIAGYLVAMTALPVSWPWILTGFVLFRIFDILKIWPANVMESRFSGGLGIMADDMVSGFQVAVILNVFRLF